MSPPSTSVDAAPAASRGTPAQRGSRSKRTSRARQAYVTKQQLNGGKLKPPQAPPDVTFQPWNSATLVFSKTNKIELTMGNIATRFKEQIDPTGHGLNPTTSSDSGFRFQFRLISVTAWNLSGKLIAMSLNDWRNIKSASIATVQLTSIVDTGNGSTTPTVGYAYPSAYSTDVLRNDAEHTSHDFGTIIGGANDALISYVKILWRFDGKPELPMSAGTLFDVLSSIYNENTRTNSHLTDLATILSRIDTSSSATAEHARPSIIKTASNAAAMLVSLVASQPAAPSGNDQPRDDPQVDESLLQSLESNDSL